MANDMVKTLSSGLRLVLLGSIMAVTGCGSAPTVFYTLEPYPSAVAVPAYRGPAVAVDAVHLPKDLDRLELIRRTGPYVMQVDDFSRWSASLGDLAQSALTQDLASRLPAGSVVFPGAAKPATATGFTVNVLDFDVDDGQDTMDVSWAWDNADPGSAAPRTLHLTVPVDGTGSKSIAGAMSRLLAKVADDVVGTLGAGG